ncbi:ATP-binding cassette subfamily G member 4-like [Culicoides brevitarsis]|uniref:ATP-binding cassette subfamily G member 4-like n=1 Tax=Culicoides brevitarsis TaxID=469753 RepID=UPI00307B15B6
MELSDDNGRPSDVLLTEVNVPVTQNARTGLNHLAKWPLVDLSFQNIKYDISDFGATKPILHGVSGCFKSQQLTAIMGPSGAGKSTLLNILAGFRQQSSGDIKINNKSREMDTFRRMSRYIMQEDVFHRMLTIREAMMVAADLKLGNVFDKKAKSEIIDEILELLRLTKAGDTLGHLLSGGERKRLSIALELVNNPPIIFLDEPTTGLDDLSSSQCISLLQHVAHGGRTVICSIHQPSAKIFAMFDNVYILSEGHCVFRGPGSNIIEYVENIGLKCPLSYNPADFIIEISCGEYGRRYIDKMIENIDTNCPLDPSDNLTKATKNSEEPNLGDYEIDVKHLKAKSSDWDQFRTLLRRNLTEIFRNRQYLMIKFYTHIFLGLLIGTLFFQMGNDASKTLYNFGFCFTIIIAFMYIPLMPILLEFPSEVKLLKREYFNQWYRLIPYYFSSMIAKMPIQLSLAVMYLTLLYILTGQPLEWHRMTMFFTISLLVFLVSECFGILVASRLSVLNAMFTGPCLLVPLMLLSVYNIGGGISNVPKYMRVLMSVSYLRYGMEGVIDAIYGYGRGDMECPDEEVFCPYKKPSFLKQIMGFEEVNFFTSLVALIFFYVIFNLAAFYLIRRRVMCQSYDNYYIKYFQSLCVKYMNNFKR